MQPAPAEPRPALAQAAAEPRPALAQAAAKPRPALAPATPKRKPATPKVGKRRAEPRLWRAPLTPPLALSARVGQFGRLPPAATTPTLPHPPGPCLQRHLCLP